MTIETKYDIGDLVKWYLGSGFGEECGTILSTEIYSQGNDAIIWYNIEKPDGSIVRWQEYFIYK